MSKNDQRRLGTNLMRAVFSVFVGDPDINFRCFNKCVRESRRTTILTAGTLSKCKGYGSWGHILRICEEKTRRKGEGIYACPTATVIMWSLARFTTLGAVPPDSVYVKHMHDLRVVEHARTAFLHDGELELRQSYFWVDRRSPQAPDEIEGSADNNGSGTDNGNNGADNSSNMADNSSSADTPATVE
ncbi:hypothetical protein GGI35DRAFT_92285 [Trichoderma velutinum]